MSARRFLPLVLGAFVLGLTMPSAQARWIQSLLVFQEVYRLTDTHFYKPIPSEKLSRSAIRGLLSALDDPYTNYLTPSEYTQLKAEQDGAFTGVGIEVGSKHDELTIVSALKGSPAAEAGLQSGDIIRKVNGQDTLSLSFAKSSSLLLGKEGSFVTLDIERPSQRRFFQVDLQRKKITIDPVEARFLKAGLGYIRINTFLNLDTSKAVREALIDLQKKPLKALVLDLRDNPGGLFSAAIEVGDMLLSEGVIVRMVSRKKEETLYRATPNILLGSEIEIYLLINHGSASSAEILAGSLQDQSRATLLGQTSFGKGLVQLVQPLSDGSALTLSTSKYLTSAGRDIHGVGLVPDIPVSSSDDGPIFAEVFRLFNILSPSG